LAQALFWRRQSLSSNNAFAYNHRTSYLINSTCFSFLFSRSALGGFPLFSGTDSYVNAWLQSNRRLATFACANIAEIPRPQITNSIETSAADKSNSAPPCNVQILRGIIEKLMRIVLNYSWNVYRLLSAGVE
jgi:hypothetical protein